MNNIYVNGTTVSVKISGRPVRLYSHEGKTFLESRVGSEYSITIKNNNSCRVEVVAAVDGLSVLTGKPAAITDSGYVIGPYAEYTIKGFRKDHNEVGAFKFVEKDNSYAAGKGQGNNVGVIAVAVYREKQPIYSTPFIQGIDDNGLTWKNPNTIGDIIITCANTHQNTSYSVGKGILRSTSYDHGTTWGSKLTDKVATTTFDREANVQSVELYYNSRAKLEEMGIKLIHEGVINTPIGFPATFAEPPAGWE